MAINIDDFLNLTQILGFIAMSLSIARYQMRTTRQIRGMGVCAAVFFSTHFFLLGSLAGCCMATIGGVRSALLLNHKLWPYRKYVAAAAIAAGLAATAIVYESWVDALPFCAVFFGIFMDVQEKATRARALGAGMQVFWLLFTTLSGSYGGMVSSSMNLLSNLIGYLRHHYAPYLRTRDRAYLQN